MHTYIITYGCKVNYYESEELLTMLSASGMDAKMVTDGSVSKLPRDADSVFVVNSCAVTNMAEKKSRYGISKIKKYHPNAKIFTMGCAFKKASPAAVAGEILGMSVCGGVVKHQREKAFIKVQDGCKNFCSFCIIPYIRNKITCRPVAEVVAEIDSQPPKVTEIVVCGINLCCYKNFGELCAAVDRCGRRWSLSSLEPPIITRSLLQLLKRCRNFMPNFHICLQSGSDKVLHDMNRHYTAAEYLDKINTVRSIFPNAKIGTDIIVGYPTETAADFEQTCRLVKSVRFDNVHVFPFSPRAGTAAAKLKPIINRIVTERFNILCKIDA
jgi:threonylcarbamoyladenosine tRNA methylthiotransferase MtaB